MYKKFSVLVYILKRVSVSTGSSDTLPHKPHFNSEMATIYTGIQSIEHIFITGLIMSLVSLNINQHFDDNVIFNQIAKLVGETTSSVTLV